VLTPEACYSPAELVWSNSGWHVTGVNERVTITDPSTTSSYRLLRLLMPQGPMALRPR
jgi:hypothetical protein